jgi:hypothetical protein
MSILDGVNKAARKPHLRERLYALFRRGVETFWTTAVIE